MAFTNSVLLGPAWSLLFGEESCGQCCYFQQMLSNINIQGERSSSICVSNPALGFSRMETKVAKQRMPALKTTNCSLLVSKFWCPCCSWICWDWFIIESLPIPGSRKLQVIVSCPQSNSNIDYTFSSFFLFYFIYLFSYFYQFYCLVSSNYWWKGQCYWEM